MKCVTRRIRVKGIGRSPTQTCRLARWLLRLLALHFAFMSLHKHAHKRRARCLFLFPFFIFFWGRLAKTRHRDCPRHSSQATSPLRAHACRCTEARLCAFASGRQAKQNLGKKRKKELSLQSATRALRDRAKREPVVGNILGLGKRAKLCCGVAFLDVRLTSPFFAVSFFANQSSLFCVEYPPETTPPFFGIIAMARWTGPRNARVVLVFLGVVSFFLGVASFFLCREEKLAKGRQPNAATMPTIIPGEKEKGKILCKAASHSRKGVIHFFLTFSFSFFFHCRLKMRAR
nr:hypothetical protein [Pandoravirus aubagnensis]